MAQHYALGLDFGTESVRAVIVDVAGGRIAAQHSAAYPHGVIDKTLPHNHAPLPHDYALQLPTDWLDSCAAACRGAIAQFSGTPASIVGLGVAFTSCTMLPTRADGTPLCTLDEFRDVPLAYPKLWKHHAAKHETSEINRVARERGEPWLARYGGNIGLEWFFPKVLETLVHAPDVYAATDVWLEAGDWFVWQLIDGPFPACDASRLVRSTCQAGYKAMWNAETGFPSADFFGALHPSMRSVVRDKMPGCLAAPGTAAGTLSVTAASLLGLPAGMPVSVAIIDAHAGVPGSGVAGDDTMVLVMGTSSCHMLNSAVERLAPGLAGVVRDGILPGHFGYETGQASVGDAFAWLVQTFGLSHADMNARAATLAPGSGGVLALDWLNGCRTPLMDGHLSGAFFGLTLTTRPEQMYRALLEATAMGVRWIVDTLRNAGVPINRFVASGGLPAKSPLLMQIYADVLDRPIELAESDQSVAIGAAILGCLAAGSETTGYRSADEAIGAMARTRGDLVYRPDAARRAAYDDLYAMYRTMADPAGPVANTMRQLRKFTVNASV